MLGHTPPHFKNAPTQYVITPMEDTYIEYTVVAWSPMNLPLTFTPSLRRKGWVDIKFNGRWLSLGYLKGYNDIIT